MEEMGRIVFTNRDQKKLIFHVGNMYDWSEWKSWNSWQNIQIIIYTVGYKCYPFFFSINFIFFFFIYSFVFYKLYSTYFNIFSALSFFFGYLLNKLLNS